MEGEGRGDRPAEARAGALPAQLRRRDGPGRAGREADAEPLRRSQAAEAVEFQSADIVEAFVAEAEKLVKEGAFTTGGSPAGVGADQVGDSASRDGVTARLLRLP